jgi:hypothetical protein
MTSTVEKVAPKFLATSVCKVAHRAKFRPSGEISPNLVTLLVSLAILIGKKVTGLSNWQAD